MPQFPRKILSWPPIAHLPVKVSKGIAQGARWSLFPWTSYWRGTHEPEVQQRIVDLVPDWTGKHVWDLGSHYGLYAVGLALRVGPRGSVAAFEPNPHSHARLLMHARRNQLQNLKAYPCAVSDVAGIQRLFLYEGLETTTSHLAYAGETWNESIPTLDISSVRLDDLVAKREIAKPDFIKVDVEGHGAKALAGALNTLSQSRPTLLVGFHSDDEVNGVLAILNPLRYHVTPVLSEAPASPTSGHDYLFEPRN